VLPFGVSRTSLQRSVDARYIESGSLAPWEVVVLPQLFPDDLKEWVVNRPRKIFNASGRWIRSIAG
jgi:hypothetical protein